jgi:PhzF family phenazine biosynthesis protein
MPSRPFAQVDVFTGTPCLGNPVAVVLDGRGLDTATMQRFTDWTNLSEATFVLPPTKPGANYALRIFCPGRELPFAGHPTLGSSHAWLQAGGQPQGEEIVQECGVGLVRIRRDGRQLAFAAPPHRRCGAAGRWTRPMSSASPAAWASLAPTSWRMPGVTTVRAGAPCC